MKKVVFILLVCVSTSNCSVHEENDLNDSSNALNFEPLEINASSIQIDSLVFDKKTSIWKINDEPYSGFVETKFENGSLKRKFGVLNGKKQNEDVIWFENGKVKSNASYHKGRLHGNKQIWSQDSLYILIADYNYYLGKGQGKQTKWYPTGELFQIRNLNEGREEGIQQAYRKNGDLYANYEAKNGRIFGLKKASLCFGLEDQNVKNDD